MGDQGWLTERFEENRPRLRGVAYRILGSLSEAEDAVQEAWLRLNRIDATTVENLGGWLTTVVSRVCLDTLRSRTSRREEPLGARGADLTVVRGEGADPEGEAMLADSVGVALLVVLDMLTPAERLAFVLHDLFDIPFDEIGSIVGRSPAAAKQLASRARRRVPGRMDTQRALIRDYGKYVERFDAVADYLARWQPPSLLVWGRHDPFFELREVLSWMQTLPRMEAHVLDAGHKLLETHATAAVSLMLDFVSRTQREGPEQTSAIALNRSL